MTSATATRANVSLTDDLSIDGLPITAIGLDLPIDLAYDEWAKLGDKLFTIERAIQWLLGDWWNFGDHAYGEMASQALPEGVAYSTFARSAQVALAFPKERRRKDLTFAHHSEVVTRGIDNEDREKLLDLAEERDLSREEFRHVVQQYKLELGTATVEPRPDSVCETDQEAIVTLIPIHAPSLEPHIVDVTHNQGAFWRGTGYKPLRLDIDPTYERMGMADMTADFRALPLDDLSVDVLVFDPPYLTNAGNHDSGLGPVSYAEGYGVIEDDEEMRAANISHLFEPFLLEAHRILRQYGIVLAKLGNAVHQGKYQDQARLFKDAGEACGFTHCDEMVKVALHRGRLLDPRWKHLWHVRGVHAFWIVLRKGNLCHRP